MPTCGNCTKFSGTASEVIAHQKKCSPNSQWADVVSLRQEGKIKSANRKARKLMGVKGKPMSDETKEKLRTHNEVNKNAIKQRKSIQKTLDKTLMAITKARKR